MMFGRGRSRYKFVAKLILIVCGIFSIAYIYNLPKDHRIYSVMPSLNKQVSRVNMLHFSSEKMKVSEPDDTNFAPVVVNEVDTTNLHHRKPDSVEWKTSNGTTGETSNEEKIMVPVVPHKKYDSPWTYVCDNNLCRRKMITKDGKFPAVSVNHCWLTCGEYGSLWPIPKQSETLNGQDTVPFQYSSLHFSIANEPSGQLKIFLEKSIELTSNILQGMVPSELQVKIKSDETLLQNTIKISLLVTSKEENMMFILEKTNETYTLEVSSEKTEKGGKLVIVKIVSDSYYGVRHGLETLTQLISYDEVNNCYQIVSKVVIKDMPSYKYRGVFIDTASNFISIPILKRIINAMSFNKFNVLRWLFADKDSFSVFHPSWPEMSICGVYSKKKMYQWKDISDLVDYARIRGIKILPVLNINYLRYLDELAIDNSSNCLSKRQKTAGQKNSYYAMDPFNSNTMHILGEFFKSWFETFDNDIFHLGSTAIDQQCLRLQKGNKAGKPVDEWMKKEKLKDYSQLWVSLLNKIVETLKETNNGKLVKVIVLDKDLTISDLLFLNSSNYIIQTIAKVDSARVETLLIHGYQLIPAEVFLDVGFTSKDSLQYALWQNIYDDPISKHPSPQMLGSEAAVWTTNANEGSIEVKLWPRACAMGERLWSNVSRTDSVFSRLNNHNFRMMQRRIPSEILQPESCYFLEGHCDDSRSI